MPDGGTQKIKIPYKPRKQFQPFHDRKQRWSLTVAHRRAGKTVARINELIKGALTCPLVEPHFAYFGPTFSQVKDIAWLYLKRYGLVVPGAKANEHELHVTFPNGGRVRLYGMENYERARGIYLDGAVFDEYGIMDPRAWQEVVRPALSDRKGWCDFIGTPNGRNHFFELLYGDAEGKVEGAQGNPDWFVSVIKASETNLIDPGELADARKTMSADQYEQEYECSFQAALVGSYFGAELAAAERENRIRNVPAEPQLLTQTWWDLGIGDATAIWFVQLLNREIRVIDYYESSGVGLDHYAKVLQEKRYVYGEHILPHDAEVKELGTGRSRIETLASLGIQARVIPRSSVDDGINAVRVLLPRTWFDATKCKRGIEALRQYRKEYNEKLKCFSNKPLHDWTSHAADAFRYGAIGLNEAPKSKPINYPALGIV